MIPKWVKQSPAFGDFSPDDQKSWFELTRSKVTAHVDTLYYSVQIRGDSSEYISEELEWLLDDLRAAKSRKTANFEAYEELFGLELKVGRFAQFYEYKLSLNENFDIFIASYIPTDSTPRIVVQLRTGMLVLKGTFQALCKSFAYVQRILADYGLEASVVRENRIDYAFHTNLIQNPYRYFSDDLLVKKMKSKLRKYQKVGEIGGRRIDIDYVSFGMRQSNDVFVRIYNKSREVVEMNYKSFFFDKWLKDGLISRYDHYVYTHAYVYASYVTGMLVSRIDWYLEYGTDEGKKAELLQAKETYYIKSDNTAALRKKVDALLPPVTIIVNIEYQTKRKFYLSLTEYFDVYGILDDPERDRYEYLENAPLRRLHVILANRKKICEYLTSESLSFVDHKGTEEECLSDWWKFIHRCPIEEYDKVQLDLWRTHSRTIDMKKQERKFYAAVANVSILKNRDVSKDLPTSFVEDIADVLCVFNDNDFYGFAPNPETGELLKIQPNDYSGIKRKRARQYRGIVEKKKEESES